MNAVIFDFDGTIADSYDQVLDFLLRRAGRDPATISADERATLRASSMKALAIMVGIPKWQLVATYFAGKHYFTKQMHHVSPIPGMDEVLEALHRENYQLFVVSSNSRRNIERFLVERGLSGYFTRTYGNAGWFGKAKTLKKVMKQYKLDPQKTAYVGDEERDVAAAHKAGMPSMAVNWGFSSEAALLAHTPTMLIRSPEELQKVLVELGRTV